MSASPTRVLNSEQLRTIADLIDVAENNHFENAPVLGTCNVNLPPYHQLLGEILPDGDGGYAFLPKLDA